MIRKILGNLVIALFIPFLLNIRWLPNVYNALLKKEYKYYDFDIKTLSEFLYHVYGENYIGSYLISLIVFLIPFQIVKDILYKRKGKISFLHKIFIITILLCIEIIIIGTFLNIRTIPWWYNFLYLGLAIGFGTIITSITYFSIDRYVEKKHDIQIGNK